ncbi:MAG: hypothetical protein H6Q69_206 [Firmicutes bacterium]|nr:hypothetical protein [Bacillota bacterium]
MFFVIILQEINVICRMKYKVFQKLGGTYLNTLFSILLLLSILFFIIGLFKPSLVIRWGNPDKRGRKKALTTYLILIVVFFIAGATTDSSENSQSQQTSQPSQGQQQTEKAAVKTYKSGQYKVGQDIPAGEYVAIANGQAYIEIAKDSKGTMQSILANDIFINRSIISVSDGQYLKVQGCELYAFKDAPKVQDNNGFLPAGMYKVGVDLPAGEYKVTSEGGDSYIETSNTSRHSMGDIVSNDIFQGDKYVTVSDGQYVKFFRAKIKVK